MKSARIIFGDAALGVKMPSARYIDPHTNKETLVQPVGTPHREGHVYYGDHMKGHVHCVDCPAHVFLSGMDAAGIMGSSLRARVPYFRTRSGERHDAACEFSTVSKPATERKTAINREKGFRLHINTGEHSELYTPKDGPYRRDGMTLDIAEDLKDREIYTVKSASDIVKFMTNKDPARINDSVVIFGNRPPVPWQKFFVRYNRNGNDQPRFMELFETLKAGGKDATSLVLMEMQIKKPCTIGSSKHTSVNSRRIPYMQDEDGTRHDIVPSALIDRLGAWHDTHLAGAFSHGKNQLVLGLATMKKARDGHYYINVKVTDADQVETVNIENIINKKLAAAAKVSPAPESAPK